MIAYFLNNISAKYHENPSMLSRVIAKNVGGVFWNTVYIVFLFCNIHTQTRYYKKWISHWVANFLSCNNTKFYQNRLTSDRVITKINMVNFLRHSVHVYNQFFTINSWYGFNNCEVSVKYDGRQNLIKNLVVVFEFSGICIFCVYDALQCNTWWWPQRRRRRRRRWR